MHNTTPFWYSLMFLSMSPYLAFRMLNSCAVRDDDYPDSGPHTMLILFRRVMEVSWSCHDLPFSTSVMHFLLNSFLPVFFFVLGFLFLFFPEGRELVVIYLPWVGIFVFLSSVVKVVLERQWLPNISWVTSPECLVEAPKSRWVCDMAHFETLFYMKY